MRVEIYSIEIFYLLVPSRIKLTGKLINFARDEHLAIFERLVSQGWSSSPKSIPIQPPPTTTHIASLGSVFPRDYRVICFEDSILLSAYRLARPDPLYDVT